MKGSDMDKIVLETKRSWDWKVFLVLATLRMAIILFALAGFQRARLILS
jgi:hypothetical protein